jgi:D-alanyl-D-alanine carboxypeptidase
MRIARISKAFTGALALRLGQEGRLGLDDTIGRRLPGVMPRAWSVVAVREMLNHTSGLPDYTRSEDFRIQAVTNPRGYVSPIQIVGWVGKKGLMFTPGSRYEYSNTDNIVVGLIEQRVTGRSFGRLLSALVFRRAGLRQTSFPTRRLSLPTPFMHGYDVKPGKPPQDGTAFLSPSGAWASGAIVSTPAELGAFVRADLGGRFFGGAQRREQLRFVAGSSARPVPAGKLPG